MFFAPEMPSDEVFDAMNDAQFNDWWDSWCMRQSEQAVSEEEVVEAEAVRATAFERRLG